MSVRRSADFHIKFVAHHRACSQSAAYPRAVLFRSVAIRRVGASPVMGGAKGEHRRVASRPHPAGSRLVKTSEAVPPLHSEHARAQRRLRNDELVGAHERAGMGIGKILPVQVYIPVAFVDSD